MTKQEFLAMSLSHGLKVYVKYYNHRPDNSELETMIGIVDDCIITDMHEEDIAPLTASNYGLCLRPLSDLTKPIEHKGEKFVPIDRLNQLFGYEKCKIVCYINNGVGWSIECDFCNTAICFDDMFNPIQKLIEWHFDIADLLSKGEAIDVNTLEENPYK